MSNIGLIIEREYVTRVKKKSFIIMTFLTPILFVGVLGLVTWLSKSKDDKTIEIVDESSLFEGAFKSNAETTYNYVVLSLEEAKHHVEKEEIDGLLYIPATIGVDDPEGIIFYTPGNPSITLIRSIEDAIEQRIENEKLLKSGLSKEVLDNLASDVSISSINLTSSGEEKASNSGAATAVGYTASFLIYMFIFLYGVQSMRGVIEEKTNRIIEVIIASVKPFNIMMGKVLGVAAVGLTQLVMWIVLTIILSTVGINYIETRTDMMDQMTEVAEVENESAFSESDLLSNVFTALDSIDIPLTLGAFVFYFIGGYLLYGALFAAVGSAVDSDADAQQFMFPITIPLIAAIASMGAILFEPHGTFAFWMSIIPFTSPIAMMVRVPFGVPFWQLGLSMLLVVVGFIFTIWVASRVYRIGILMHGAKVNYKTLAKWFMMKN